MDFTFFLFVFKLTSSICFFVCFLLHCFSCVSSSHPLQSVFFFFSNILLYNFTAPISFDVFLFSTFFLHRLLCLHFLFNPPPLLSYYTLLYFSFSVFPFGSVIPTNRIFLSSSFCFLVQQYSSAQFSYGVSSASFSSLEFSLILDLFLRSSSSFYSFHINFYDTAKWGHQRPSKISWSRYRKIKHS